MRPTRMGCLRFLFACLLAGLPLAARAGGNDMDMKPNTNTPGGLKTANAASFVIDRSPMATAVNTQTRGAESAFHFALQYALKSDVIDKPKALFERIEAEILALRNHDFNSQTLGFFDQFLQTAAPGAPQKKLKDELESTLRSVQADILRSAETTVNDADFADQATPTAQENPVLANTASFIRAQARYRAVVLYYVTQYVRQALPLRKEIYAVEQQSRWIGSQSVFATGLTYSNAELRSDFVAQYVSASGADHGYGFAFHHAFDGYSPPPEPGKKEIAAVSGAFPNNTKMPAAIHDPYIIQQLQQDIAVKESNDISAAAKASVYEATKKLKHYLLLTHTGSDFEYLHLNHVGDSYAMGLSASALQPQRFGHRYNAFYYGADLHYQWFQAEEDSGYSSDKGIGFSFIVALQDNAPRETKDKLGQPSTDLGRWHRRIGFEFSPHDRLANHDYAAFFARWREDANEVTLHIGSEANGQVFVGLSLSAYFGRKNQVTPDTVTRSPAQAVPPGKGG